MIDFIAQYLFFMFLLICIKNRVLIWCSVDGNVENKANRDALEAMWWLDRMERVRVI